MPATVRTNAVITASFGSFLAPFMVSGLIVALPAIGNEFALDAVSLSWLTSVFFMSSAAFLIPVGRLSDIWGIKRVFRAGTLLYAFTAAACGIAPDFFVLLGGRFLAGVAGAAVFSTSIALITFAVPAHERGRAIGINVTAMVTGFSLGFLAGGFLTFYTGWRTIFLIVIPVAVIPALMSTRIPGECALAAHRKPDLPGMILASSGILLLMAGLSAVTTLPGMAAFLGGCLLTGAFIFAELRNVSPMLDIRVLSGNRVFILANITDFLYFAGGFASIFLLSLYLQTIRGLDPRFAGIFLLVQPVMMSFAVYGGKLADRFRPWKVAGAGAALSVLPIAYFIFLDENTPLAAIFIALAVLGIGVALFQPSVAKAVVSSVNPDFYGLASGTVETMRLTGNTVSTAFSSIGFALLLGTSVVTREGSAQFILVLHLLFVIYTLVSLAMCIAVAQLRRECGIARAKDITGEQGLTPDEKQCLLEPNRPGG